jgi:hypothetical protein
LGRVCRDAALLSPNILDKVCRTSLMKSPSFRCWRPLSLPCCCVWFWRSYDPIRLGHVKILNAAPSHQL